MVAPILCGEDASPIVGDDFDCSLSKVLLQEMGDELRSLLH